MRRSLSVGIVCHFPPPPGGMPGQAEALVQRLDEAGMRTVRIATNLGGGPLRQRLDAMRFVRTFLRWPVFLARLLRRIGTVDVVHVNTCSGLYYFIFALPALALGRALNRRVVLHYHSGAAATFFRQWPRAIRLGARLADRTIVPSPFLQEIFAHYGVASDVVPNICELERFTFAPGRDRPATLIVARHLEPNYNVGCVLRAFARVRTSRPDATLTVLGGGSEAGALESLAATLGIQDAVDFIGYVDNRDIPAFFAKSSVFVNASNVDNMPIAILEAFAAGLPVVTTNPGGIPYMVDDRRTGLLVSTNDDAALASRILEVLNDPILARRLAEAARRDAERYRWRRILPQLQQVYGVAPDAAGAEIVAAEDAAPRAADMVESADCSRLRAM